MLLTTQQADSIHSSCVKLSAAIPDEGERHARDWAGFLAALSALIQNILPLIIPLFLEPKEE